ncbi:MAG TPA: hemerythrin domain-containing protein [Steroidobacteraceae bacterium]
MNTRHPDSTSAAGSSGAGSQRTPEEIEADIGRTRADLDNTLDALKSRLSPSQRLREAANSARQLGRRAAQAARPIAPYITTMIRLDHTHALALFRRIRPWTSAGRKRAIITNACIALEVHAQLEEEIFYPALRKALGDDELLDKSVPEHDEMRELVRSLRGKDVEAADYDETVHSLMQAVLHHVADEESMLLPQAELLLGDELADLGLQMTRRRMELLRPHLSEVAVTFARSFPVATAAAAAGLLAVGWMLLRPGSRSQRRWD